MGKELRSYFMGSYAERRARLKKPIPFALSHAKAPREAEYASPLPSARQHLRPSLASEPVAARFSLNVLDQELLDALHHRFVSARRPLTYQEFIVAIAGTLLSSPVPDIRSTASSPHFLEDALAVCRKLDSTGAGRIAWASLSSYLTTVNAPALESSTAISNPGVASNGENADVTNLSFIKSASLLASATAHATSALMLSEPHLTGGAASSCAILYGGSPSAPIVDLVARKRVGMLTGAHSAPITCAAIGGKDLVWTTGLDCILTCWHWPSATPVMVQTLSKPAISLAWSTVSLNDATETSVLFVGDQDGDISIFNCADMSDGSVPVPSEVHKRAHKGWVTHLLAVPLLGLVFSGGSDGGVVLIDIPTRSIRRRFRVHHRGISAMTFSSSLRVLVVGTYGRTVSTLNIFAEDVSAGGRLATHDAAVVSMTCLSGPLVVATDSTGATRVHDIRRSVCVSELAASASTPAIGAAFDPTSKSLLIVGGVETTIFRAAGHTLQRSAATAPIFDVQRFGDIIAVGSESSEVILWSSQTGLPVRRITPAPGDKVCAFALDSLGRFLIAATQSGQIVLCDIDFGAVLGTTSLSNAGSRNQSILNLVAPRRQKSTQRTMCAVLPVDRLRVVFTSVLGRDGAPPLSTSVKFRTPVTLIRAVHDSVCVVSPATVLNVYSNTATPIGKIVALAPIIDIVPCDYFFAVVLESNVTLLVTPCLSIIGYFELPTECNVTVECSRCSMGDALVFATQNSIVELILPPYDEILAQFEKCATPLSNVHCRRMNTAGSSTGLQGNPAALAVDVRVVDRETPGGVATVTAIDNHILAIGGWSGTVTVSAIDSGATVGELWRCGSGFRWQALGNGENLVDEGEVAALRTAVHALEATVIHEALSLPEDGVLRRHVESIKTSSEPVRDFPPAQLDFVQLEADARVSALRVGAQAVRAAQAVAAPEPVEDLAMHFIDHPITLPPARDVRQPATRGQLHNQYTTEPLQLLADHRARHSHRKSVREILAETAGMEHSVDLT